MAHPSTQHIVHHPTHTTTKQGHAYGTRRGGAPASLVCQDTTAPILQTHAGSRRNGAATAAQLGQLMQLRQCMRETHRTWTQRHSLPDMRLRQSTVLCCQTMSKLPLRRVRSTSSQARGVALPLAAEAALLEGGCNAAHSRHPTALVQPLLASTQETGWRAQAVPQKQMCPLYAC